MRHLCLVALCALPLSLAACETGGGGGHDAFDADATDATDADTGRDTSWVDTVGPCVRKTPADFDDHSVLGFDRLDCLLAYGDTGEVPLQLKFVAVDFESAEPDVHWLEPGFYQLHDEWSWFRLLNGAAIPGYSLAPLPGGHFATVAAIYDALQGQTELPLDLLFVPQGNRLYSPRFYAECGFAPGMAAPRFFGVGSLLYYPENPDRAHPDAFWAFELEYVDRPELPEVERFFEVLGGSLPAEVSDQLMWLTRSPTQETLGAVIKSGGGPYAQRVLTYDDLVVDGEVVGYNPGVAAGYVHVFQGEITSTDADPDEIVILSRVPDDIPPVAALISAVPQTPLAHVNLLAKARGTPNAYVGGILEWQQLGSWDYTRQPVAVKVTEDDIAWRELACHKEQVDENTYRTVCPEWDTYRALKTVPTRTITQVDIATLPYVVDVTDGGLADLAARVPLVGGKCAGMLAFRDFPEMETPGTPLAISIRAYHEHIAPLRATLEALLTSEAFVAEARVRFLTLEGEDDFRDAHAGDVQALSWATGFIAAHQGDLYGEVVGQGGVKRMVRDLAIAPDTLATLTAALTERFAWLAPTQGLRFRSSATAEDVPGFNGAGLYDSNTGFLHPEQQADPDDRKKSVAWALKKTWASYWGFPAFEERRVARVDHLSGNMGVLVHPRFDDALEDANGVMTMHVSRWFTPTQRRLVVNVQEGSLSVTNPGGTLALPEIDEVLIDPDGAVSIRRVQASTEVESGTVILSDAELTTLGEQVSVLADAWLDRPDESVPDTERAGALVLDLEIKRMAAGWPALASGETLPERLIYKQVRVLDRAPVVEDQADPWLSTVKLAMWLPRDLRTVARRVEGARCQSPYADLRVLQVLTERPAADLYPFAETPWMYRVYVRLTNAPAGWSWPAQPYFLPHESLAEASYTPGGGIDLTLAPSSAELMGVDSLHFGLDGSWSMRRGEETLSGLGAGCDERTPYVSASEYLEQLFAAP
ncbi:MAG: hypothetical protein EP329_20270 [Deltaproteobacteria bacterium]|nr:MAG: hypothetical protein EP329_20270 [Deltaproteobacteria bacterium]